MTKIYVKNGDWDKARAELGADMEAKRKTFNAQFDSVFGAAAKTTKPAETPAPDLRPAALKATGPLVLSRSRRF